MNKNKIEKDRATETSLQCKTVREGPKNIFKKLREAIREKLENWRETIRSEWF